MSVYIDSFEKLISNLYKDWEGLYDRKFITFYSDRLEITYSYEEYLSLINSITNHLSQTINYSDKYRVAILTRNDAFTPAIIMALFLLGCDVVPLNPHDDPCNWSYIIANSEISCVLLGNDINPTNTHEIKYFGIEIVVKIAKKDSDSSLKSIPIKKKPPRLIMYTSGTTDKPKGVLLSESALISNAQSLVKNFSLSRTIHLCTLPLHHAHAFGLGFLTTLLSQGHLILSDGLNVFLWSKAIKKYSVEFSSAVPSQLYLLEKFSRSFGDISNLKRLVISSAPINQSICKSFEDKTNIKIFSGWGLTEYSNFATCIGIDESIRRKVLYDETWPSVGKELDKVSVRIGNYENGIFKETREDELGELYISGPSLFSGYLNNSEATIKTMKDGFLKTGDLGFWKLIDNQRYFYIAGRKKEIINRAGEKLSPIQIEMLIDEIDFFQGIEFAIVGFKHNAFGEEVGMYIQDNGNIEYNEVIQKLKDKLHDSIVPKVVIICNKEIPKTITGKIQRQKMVELYRDYDNHAGEIILHNRKNSYEKEDIHAK